MAKQKTDKDQLAEALAERPWMLQYAPYEGIADDARDLGYAFVANSVDPTQPGWLYFLG